jgi:hypothetical protein
VKENYCEFEVPKMTLGESSQKVNMTKGIAGRDMGLARRGDVLLKA